MIALLADLLGPLRTLFAGGGAVCCDLDGSSLARFIPALDAAMVAEVAAAVDLVYPPRRLAGRSLARRLSGRFTAPPRLAVLAPMRVGGRRVEAIEATD